MIPLAKLKQDMEFMKDMEEIINTFKITALAQFRLFQNKEKANDIFQKEIDSFSRLFSTQNFSSPFFVREQEGGAQQTDAKAIVMVTSDGGFLGGLNTLVVDVGLQRRTSVADELIVVGERGARYLEDKNAKAMGFRGIDEDVSQGHIDQLCDYLLKGYDKRFKKIFIVYPEFISLTAQKVTTVMLLPYVISKPSQSRVKRYLKDILIEASSESVAKVFGEMWLEFKLLEMFFSAKQSEYGARIMHLEGSLQEISHLKEKLTLAYFRQLHALRDKTIREISAARILLKEEVV